MHFSASLRKNYTDLGLPNSFTSYLSAVFFIGSLVFRHSIRNAESVPLIIRTD